MQLCRSLAAAIDRMNEQIGRLVSWLTLAMVLITFGIVMLRYLFDTGWIALQESVSYLHALVFMLGAAYTLKRDGHVRVDIFYQQCSVKTKAWIDLFGSILLLLPLAGFMLWSCWEYVANAWAIQESSRNSGGLPGVYLLKTAMLIMATQLILQGLALIIHKLLVITGKDERLHQHG